jgi:hypothetical protein
MKQTFKLFIFLISLSGLAICQPLNQPPSPSWEDSIDFGCCNKVSPIDQGIAFAGPQFLLFDNKLHLFKKSINYDPSLLVPKWRQTESINLPGKMISAGIDRVRLKWRDNKFWVKSKTKIYRQENQKQPWFMVINAESEYNDFDVTLGGDIILVATWNPKTEKPRALLELLKYDGKTSKIIAEFPDPLPTRPVSGPGSMLAYRLNFAYESIQIQEFIVIFNPVARRVFVYSMLNDTLKEVNMKIPLRTYKDLEWNSLKQPAKLRDLCWQVIPNGDSGAWIVVPDIAKEPGTLQAISTEKLPTLSYIAFPLNLLDGSIEDPVDLSGNDFPYFVNSEGQLKSLETALKTLDQSGEKTVRNNSLMLICSTEI